MNNKILIMTTITNNDIQNLNIQLNALKNVIDNISNVLTTFNNNISNNITNNITNKNNKNTKNNINTQDSLKPEKRFYRNFVINNNDENAKNKVEQFYKQLDYTYPNSKTENNIYNENTNIYINVPIEELMKHLDMSLSNTHILDIIRKNKDKIKEYNETNFSFVFYKNIVNTYVIIMKNLLNNICNEKDSNGKFPIFEKMTEIIMKYSVFFTDELFTKEFIKFKKVVTMKSLEFSANDGCIGGFLLFAFLHPDMITEDCYLYINNDSPNYINNNLERFMIHPNIKNMYDMYSSYVDKNKHIFETENNNEMKCIDCGHSCNKYCDDDCVGYIYRGDYYNYCKFCNKDDDNNNKNNDGYKYCKYCNGECSCE